MLLVKVSYGQLQPACGLRMLSPGVQELLFRVYDAWMPLCVHMILWMVQHPPLGNYLFLFLIQLFRTTRKTIYQAAAMKGKTNLRNVSWN